MVWIIGVCGKCGLQIEGNDDTWTWRNNDKDNRDKDHRDCSKAYFKEPRGNKFIGE